MPRLKMVFVYCVTLVISGISTEFQLCYIKRLKGDLKIRKSAPTVLRDRVDGDDLIIKTNLIRYFQKNFKSRISLK